MHKAVIILALLFSSFPLKAMAAQDYEKLISSLEPQSQDPNDPIGSFDASIKLFEASNALGMQQKARIYLEQANTIAGKEQNVMLRSLFLATLCDRYVRMGRIDNALELSRHIPAEDARCDAMLKIAYSLVTAGRFKEASSLRQEITYKYDRAIIDDLLSKPHIQFRTLIALAQTAIASGDITRARQILFMAMSRQNLIKSTFRRQQIMCEIALSFAKLRDYAVCENISNQMELPSLKKIILKRLIEQYLTSTRKNDAYALINKARDPAMRDSLLAYTAVYLNSHGDRTAALNLCGHIRGLPERLSAAAEIAKNGTN